ncbi:MAG: glycoside hydrolase family 13 protein [Coriobacteriales bacterium]|jgi:glycosidase|nr:glycoside hydrolase family 13 protein [Coriobacteriales bacterium]
MAHISFNGIEVSDTNIIHDSTKEVFRYPTGAVTSGTEITLALRLTGLHIDCATLCVLRGSTIDRVEMWIENDMLRAWYTAPITGDGRGMVLWYWFELNLQGGTVCYYGSEPSYPSGLGCIYQNPPPSFQITVYNEAFDTPRWAKTAIMYQIFPDRFCMGDPERARAGIEYHQQRGRNEIELHENWGGNPLYEAKEGQLYYMPGDMFGGDLEGIRQRLPYLASLGISLIYLNPIFEATSNHRYNTGDYLKIDPILGDDEVFRTLVQEAKQAGIRIILDGVFSHTGDDSLYFNKYGRYDGLGAFQSTESPYFGWYQFDEYPWKYTSWWGFDTLPEVNEYDFAWRDFIITGNESVIKHWIDRGAAGYRLDVADELPDVVIELMRTAVKQADPEALLLGEVWEDATVKQSYGCPRTYALGRGLDTVMNYPFLNRTVEFVTGKINAWQYRRFLLHQQQVYPPPMYYTLMNLLSSHDVCRVRSRLAADYDAGSMSRSEQAHVRLTEDEYTLGGQRQRLAAALQYSLPGIPAVYYGDEVGMTGLLDPFNRKTWREEDATITEWYAWLGKLRTSHPVMSTGFVRFFGTNGKVVGILRHTVLGRDYFDCEIGSDAVLTVVNPTDAVQRIVIDVGEVADDLPRGPIGEAVLGDTLVAVSLLTGFEAPLEKGLIALDVAPYGVEILGIA